MSANNQSSESPAARKPAAAGNPGADMKPPRKKRSVVKMAFVFLGVALLVALLLMALPLLISRAANDAIIKIPKGASLQMVEDSIAKYLDQDYATKVMRVAWLKGSDYSARHGAYLIPEGMSPFMAEHRLSKGAQHPVTVTINSMRGMSRLADRVASKLDFSSREFLDAATDPEFLKDFNLTPDQALALFIDDSYEAYWSASPHSLLYKIGRNYNKIWNEERLAKAKELGLSPAEVITICSITDEETNKLAEKGDIGRLYINRYKKGMKLQADPTVKFALGDFSLRRILSSHLKVESPYNTYRNKGLPPGPIRTTSLATIDAVLNSKPHDYLFMCAKEDFSGFHNFASTYSEHMANARRYQQALNRRGIR